MYVQAFPDNGAKVQISTNGGSHPKWSKNSSELFYRTDDLRIMAAAYNPKDDSFIADKPRLWSERQLANTGLNPAFDLTPDANRVLALMPADIAVAAETQGHATVVVNFLDELRRRIPD